jgi:N-acyl-D-amino-acid deacylase
MRYIMSFVFVLLSIVFCSSQLSNISVQLDTALTKLYNTGRFNGAVLYAENGKILFQKSLGVTDIATNKPLIPESSFNLASISKQFVAMCIMMLEEKGKLSIDDNVKKYIPELPYENVSIRHLLTHTSGIPDYESLFIQNRSPLDTLDNEKMVKLFVNLKPSIDFEPGTKWNYSNTGYILLAVVIERISKQTLAGFVDENIVKPLGLKHTYVHNVYNSNIPVTHVRGFSEKDGKRVINDLFYIDGVTGDGNFYASAGDLLNWEQALNTEKLVKKSTLKKVFSPVKLKDGTTYPYGFGWFIDKENEQYSHTGSWVGFKNLIIRDVKNQRTLIFLSSGDNELARNAVRSIFSGSAASIPNTFLITNIRLIDGTNTPTRNVSVRIEGDKISAVGDLKPYKDEIIEDGQGKILAPGFIDTHSHIESSLNRMPEAIAALNQGITTIVSGQDGGSYLMDTLKTRFEKTPRAVNVATYTGHATLREMAMGNNDLNRMSTPAEMEKMKNLLAEELSKGSLGLSSGLEYEEGFYASRHEVIELAKVAAKAKTRYISHIRSEDINMTDAIDEIIDIGRIAKLPVQISHLKIALKDEWGTGPALLAKLQSARMDGIDITADCYPYDFWNSTIRVLFPKKNFTSLSGSNYAIDHLFDPFGSVMVRFAPEPSYIGKTISEIAKMRNENIAKTLLYLVAAAESYEKDHPDASGIETIMGKSMTDSDIVPFLSWAHTNICSDGAIGGHPRGFGAFTRVLGYYVRDKKIMRLENAIQKMTSLAAEHVGLKKRGVIASGYFADMVLFDPEIVKDNSDIKNPGALSDGILSVWVNGIKVYKDKKSTQKYPGKLLLKE